MYKKIIIGVVALVVIGGVAGLWYTGFLGGERAVRRSISSNPEWLANYEKAKQREAEIQKNPEKAGLYFSLGLAWKSIGELGGPKEFFNRSLAVYEQGIAKFGAQNILFYLNAGKLAERVDDLAKAENYYKKAIEISPADDSGYKYLAELYEYRLKKSKAEVLAVFHMGDIKMVNPSSLLMAEASYLHRVGDVLGALKIYRVLVEAYPSNQGYKRVVQELETEAAAQK